MVKTSDAAHRIGINGDVRPQKPYWSAATRHWPLSGTRLSAPSLDFACVSIHAAAAQAPYTMTRIMRHLMLIAAAYTLAMIVLGFMAGRASAQHHPLHEDFYRRWMQPNGAGSCCNARITHSNGHETGDCEPTEARLIAGRWYARLPHAGPFVEVPEDKLVREINPTQDGTDAHLCWTAAAGVLCFLPPFGGG